MRSPRLALRYTQLAAERGVRTAAAALAHAYATGGSVGAGVLPGPLPAAAVSWLRRALEEPAPDPALFAAAPDALGGRSPGGAAAAASGSGPSGAAAAATPPPGVGRSPSGRSSGLMKRLGSRVLRGSPAPLPSPLVGPDGVPVGR